MLCKLPNNPNETSIVDILSGTRYYWHAQLATLPRLALRRGGLSLPFACRIEPGQCHNRESGQCHSQQ